MSENGHSDESNHEETWQRPKGRSMVWQFFKRTNQTSIQCHLCQHKQNYHGTTGNILRHLKSKHDLDLTLKGRQDPTNQKRIKKFCDIAAAASGRAIQTDHYSGSNLSMAATKRKQSTDNAFDTNPHEENDVDSVHPIETYVTSENPFLMNEDSMGTIEGEKLADDTKYNKRPQSLQDDLIKAETRFYNEKADYYKLLKHLTALQAKKVKIEIELLTTSSDNKIV